MKKVLGRASVNLVTLQTIIVEIEAILNDHPLTYASTDIRDLDLLTPSCLLYGRRITSLPHPDVEADEVDDPTYGSDTELRKSAARVSLLIQNFWQRWKQEYLTSLREFHGSSRSSDNNTKIKIGDVVQIHSDDKRRVKWKLGVVEGLLKGADDAVRAVTLRTAKGHTNRPIARLYPLEISEDIDEGSVKAAQGKQPPTASRRSRRTTAIKAKERIAGWAKLLRAASPPEDVGT